ncbi:MAG: 16S rRNA (uracil(1498)-N(3))-methyltransferase [Dysgonamonadaceae bacterium]|jgi:16S rRNA (uracil1498-N3)-methyltransferase|nr:16S rRNA (uracil(1498)-N(3))-methyltransferase [Dysgonamonadaceae bacterium]
MQLFYTPDIVSNSQLPETEAQHCLTVLRLKADDIIRLTDGKGNFYNAAIAEANPKHCRLRILETFPKAPLWKGKIEIAMAPTKNSERTEWFAEKATEIGIDTISFLHCRFSERKDIKTERINKILISAMKQSMKARLPELKGIVDFKTFIQQDFDGRKFIAHCYPGEKQALSQAYRKDENVLILIGPEGDFSEEEIALAEEQGFTPVSLGESRLRTETAALIACHTIHIVNQLL